MINKKMLKSAIMVSIGGLIFAISMFMAVGGVNHGEIPEGGVPKTFFGLLFYTSWIRFRGGPQYWIISVGLLLFLVGILYHFIITALTTKKPLIMIGSILSSIGLFGIYSTWISSKIDWEFNASSISVYSNFYVWMSACYVIGTLIALMGYVTYREFFERARITGIILFVLAFISNLVFGILIIPNAIPDRSNILVEDFNQISELLNIHLVIQIIQVIMLVIHVWVSSFLGTVLYGKGEIKQSTLRFNKKQNRKRNTNKVQKNDNKTLVFIGASIATLFGTIYGSILLSNFYFLDVSIESIYNSSRFLTGKITILNILLLLTYIGCTIFFIAEYRNSRIFIKLGSIMLILYLIHRIANMIFPLGSIFFIIGNSSGIESNIFNTLSIIFYTMEYWGYKYIGLASYLIGSIKYRKQLKISTLSLIFTIFSWTFVQSLFPTPPLDFGYYGIYYEFYYIMIQEISLIIGIIPHVWVIALTKLNYLNKIERDELVENTIEPANKFKSYMEQEQTSKNKRKNAAKIKKRTRNSEDVEFII